MYAIAHITAEPKEKYFASHLVLRSLVLETYLELPWTSL